jgi:hypothetical protein
MVANAQRRQGGASVGAVDSFGARIDDIGLPIRPTRQQDIVPRPSVVLKSGPKALRLVRSADGRVLRVTKSGAYKPVKTIKKVKKQAKKAKKQAKKAKKQGKAKKGQGQIKQLVQKVAKKAVEDAISCEREDLQQLGKVAKDGRAPREQRLEAVTKLDAASFKCRGVNEALDNPDGKKIKAGQARREFLAKSVGAELRKANAEREDELLAITDPQKLDAAWRARMLAEGVA